MIAKTTLAARNAAQLVRAGMVRANRSPICYWCSRQLYRIIGWFAVRRFSSVESVLSIYLTHGIAVGELYPGLSDFDLVIVFRDTNRAEFYRELRKVWNSLRFYLPVRDVSIYTEEEFEQWQRFGGGFEPLEEVQHWKLVYGSELRILNDTVSSDDDTAVLRRDRIRCALGYYRKLLQTTLKEERLKSFSAVNARRELFKAFCSTLFTLDPSLLRIPSQRNRLEKWIAQHPADEEPKIFDEMYRRRFFDTEISTQRFSTAAYVYDYLDSYFRDTPLVYSISALPKPNAALKAESSNHHDIVATIRPLVNTTVELIGDKIEAITLSSNGSVRGYLLFVILKEGLSQEQIRCIFQELRVAFLIHDDPWFNEHFLVDVPIVCSKATFAHQIKVVPQFGWYIEHFPCVLYGHLPVVLESEKVELLYDANEELLREKLAVCRFTHQTYLEKLIPALYDLLTLYFPRLRLQIAGGWSPVTIEQAVAGAMDELAPDAADLSKRLLESYRDHDLYTLNCGLDEAVFWEALEHFMAAALEQEKSVRKVA